MLLDKMGNYIRNPIKEERIDNEAYIYQNFELFDHPEKSYKQPEVQREPIPKNQDNQYSVERPKQSDQENEYRVERSTQPEEEQKTEDSRNEIVDIYSVALDSFLYDDSSIKYIALDLNNHMCVNLSNEDKKEIMKYFEEYGLEVFNNSLPSLKILGKTDEENAIEGILLTLTNLIFMREDTVIIEGYRYQNAQAVVGFRNQICKENGSWILKDRKKLWD